MATKTNKIPAKLFVVTQHRVEHTYGMVDGEYASTGNSEYSLGFLHPHEPGLKADLKRKETQLEWAAQGITSHTSPLYESGGSWFCDVHPDYRNWQNIVTQEVPPERTPVVWVNEPLDGFTIVDTVSRYRGNKLFRVLDPRGIQFEISAASLFEIITTGTIEKGTVLNKCVWKGNTNLVIVN